MNELELRVLTILGEQEFTPAEDLFAHFSMTPMGDMLGAIHDMLERGEIKILDIDNEKVYTRTMKGREVLHPSQPGDTDDIPF
jgi:hypothetical protein